jgi:hypothetical protein
MTSEQRNKHRVEIGGAGLGLCAEKYNLRPGVHLFILFILLFNGMKYILLLISHSAVHVM